MTAIVAPTCARLPAYGSRIELCLSSLPSLFKVLRQGASRRRLFLVWRRKVDHCDRQTLTAIPRAPPQYFRCGVEPERLGREYTEFVCASDPSLLCGGPFSWHAWTTTPSGRRWHPLRLARLPAAPHACRRAGGDGSPKWTNEILCAPPLLSNLLELVRLGSATSLGLQVKGIGKSMRPSPASCANATLQ